MISDSEREKMLTFCGWTLRNKAEDSEANKYGFVVINAWYNPEGKVSELPELTTDWLFQNFIPAWNKAHPENQIFQVIFNIPEKTTSIFHGWFTPEEIQPSSTEQEAFLNAALKLLETNWLENGKKFNTVRKD